MPRPDWGQVRDFCKKHGYEEERDADHWYYDKVLSDGKSSWTKISHGKDAVQVPKNLWTLVYRHQLRLRSEDDFWRGLNGDPFQYDIPPLPEPGEPLPEYLVRHLRTVRHFTDEQVAATSRQEAERFLLEHYSRELIE
jgi:hypothetical protein